MVRVGDVDDVEGSVVGTCRVDEGILVDDQWSFPSRTSSLGNAGEPAGAEMQSGGGARTG